MTQLLLNTNQENSQYECESVECLSRKVWEAGNTGLDWISTMAMLDIWDIHQECWFKLGYKQCSLPAKPFSMAFYIVPGPVKLISRLAIVFVITLTRPYQSLTQAAAVTRPGPTLHVWAYARECLFKICQVIGFVRCVSNLNTAIPKAITYVIYCHYVVIVNTANSSNSTGLGCVYLVCYS